MSPCCAWVSAACLTAQRGAGDALQTELARNTILRNIFQVCVCVCVLSPCHPHEQMVVVASGVDWAADEALCTAMLSCGSSPL
jgi:hypothetical protein